MGDTIRAITAGFGELGVTGVSVGLAILAGYLIWLRWTEGKQDTAAIDALKANTEALNALADQMTSNNAMAGRLHDRMETVKGRQAEVFSRLEAITTVLAELKGRASL